MSKLLGTIVKAAVGALLESLLGAWQKYRQEQALKKQGALEAKEESNAKATEARRAADRIRDRLRTDPEYRKRVREHFRPDSSGE